MKKPSLLNEATLHGFALAGSLIKPPGIPILHYHSVNGENMASVTKDSFCEQMRYLHDNGYNVIPLHSLVRNIIEKKPIERKSLVITFDDGYKTNYEIAYPVLNRYGFSATIFVTTGSIGGVNDWDDIDGVKGLPLLSKKEIKEMSRGGMHFGAHTDTHPDLTRIRTEEIRSEVALSKSKLEDITGKEAAFFAYPYGRYNDVARDLIAECGLKGACTTKPGLNTQGSDLFLLKRSGVFRNATINGFKTRLNGSFAWYFDTKKIFR